MLVAVIWLARDFLRTEAGQFLVEDDGPRKADTIVVMGGDEFGARITKAAQLQKAGYAAYVLVSGPPSLLGHESDETIEFARRQGYDRSIFRPLPQEADSTRTETAIVGRYLRTHSIRTILLVTSNYHTRRAARLMREQNPGLQVFVVPAPDPFFTPGTWWKTRSGQKTFIYEWLKTMATAAGV